MNIRGNVVLFLSTIAVILSFGTASSVTIRENTAGTATAVDGYWGQSVVTGSGDFWSDISFNFFDGAGDLAFGNLFLLTSEYLGAPSALSIATTGYVGQAGAAGGSYNFDPSVTLMANTQYWFYTDSTASGVLVGNTPSGVAGENHYFSNTADGNFNGPFNGVNFRLTGTVVPLPAALPLMAGGLAILGLLGWRRRSIAA